MPHAARPGPATHVRPGRIHLVYLDANILLPEYLRSVFLDLADAGIIRVYWSQTVLAEVRRNLLKPKFGRTPKAADALLRLLAEAFPDALVSGAEILESRFVGSTDPKDCHVAAAALKLSLDVYGGEPVWLVTNNIRHLPSSAFRATQVTPLRPDSFLVQLLAADQRVVDVLNAMLKRFKAPLMTQEDFLYVMDRCGCPNFATALAEHWGFLADTTP
jgi:predicted nucleic acid-binding protein